MSEHPIDLMRALKIENPKNLKVRRALQYSFDFSGRTKGMLEPESRTYDYSYEAIFNSDNGRISFDFETLDKLLAQEDEVFSGDEVLIGGSLMRTTESDEWSSSSSIWSEVYSIRVGDIPRLGRALQQHQPRYISHAVPVLFFDKKTGTTFVADIGC